MTTFANIEAAQAYLRGVVRRTPLFHSHALSRRLGGAIYLKAEMLQRTGSFKLRGASYKIASLSAADRQRGVIAASAGNHAQGVAVAAALAQIPAVVVMPTGAPAAKLAAARDYGAEVIVQGAHYGEALAAAAALQQKRGLTMVHGFNDHAVVAGQGTIGLEILDELPDLDTVVVPIGGGGLIAGVALAIKARSPRVRVIGVQAERIASTVASLTAGTPVRVPGATTLADGMAVERPGEIPFALIQQYVDQVVTVTEGEIARAIVLLLERAKLLAEGAGATPLAAILGGKVDPTGQRLVLVLSGGNIDRTRLTSVLADAG